MLMNSETFSKETEAAKENISNKFRTTSAKTIPMLHPREDSLIKDKMRIRKKKKTMKNLKKKTMITTIPTPDPRSLAIR